MGLRTALPTGDVAVIGASFGTAVTSAVYFVLKTERVRTRAFVHSRETTGDGDTNPVFLDSGLVYGSWAINGWMLAGAANELKTSLLADQHDSNGDPKYTLTVSLAANRGFEDKGVLIQDMVLEYVRKAEVIGVSMRGVFTDSAPGDI